MNRPSRLIVLLIALASLAGCQARPPASPLPSSPPRTLPATAAAAPATTTVTAAGTASPPSPTAPPPTAALPPTPLPTEKKTTTMLFTGVIVPARCVQAAIDAYGDTEYIYDDVRSIIQSADLAVGTLNATISDYPPHTGCVPTYVLVGGAANADALARAGFDVMSVATNHIKNCGLANCGDRAFFDTLDNLRRVDILPVGAGKNHAEAMQPVVVTLNGVRFGFVSLGQIEELAFAGENTPGIAVLTEANLQAAIAAARQAADVVIAMPHWGPEDVSTPTWIQRNLAHSLVEAGADLVVGNHTHVVQGLQEINGIPVFYGLGNFVFDQDLDDHQQGVILLVRFEGHRYAGYEFIPTYFEPDGRVRLAGPPIAEQILERIRLASQGLR